MAKLRASELANLPAKKHHDGDGLYFDKKLRGAAWIYKYTLNGRSREMGLGKFPDVSLAKARDLASKARGLKASGSDPIDERDAVKRRGVTFEEAATEYWQVHCQGMAKPSNWINGMRINVFPKVGHKPVTSLTPDDFMKALKPIWHQPKTRKLRQWCNNVIKYVSVDDPRVDRDLLAKVDNRLGPQKIVGENHPSVPWQQIPNLWMALPDTLVGVSMRLLILSAVRVNCVCLADWEEFDFKAKTWTIPQGRIKGWRYGYRVPLTREMIDLMHIAKRMWGDKGFVFKSDASASGHLSNNAHRLWLHTHEWKDADGRLATAHGMRTSFRNWSDDEFRVDHMLGEHIIQHMTGLGTATEKAYLRTDKLERRREVLKAWSTYCVSGVARQREAANDLAALDDVVDGDGRTKREILLDGRFDGLEGEPSPATTLAEIDAFYNKDRGN